MKTCLSFLVSESTKLLANGIESKISDRSDPVDTENQASTELDLSCRYSVNWQFLLVQRPMYTSKEIQGRSARVAIPAYSSQYSSSTQENTQERWLRSVV